MAKNINPLKRLEVKYVRDGIKSRYKLKTECEICGTTEELENHHYNTVNLLWEKWKKDNNIIIESAEEIYVQREAFYSAYLKEMITDLVTLCNTHHLKLHSVYGKEPPLFTASKQINWVSKQKEKLIDVVK